MTVYIETGYDGKERKFVYGNGYYRKIYKQYSISNYKRSKVYNCYKSNFKK